MNKKIEDVIFYFKVFKTFPGYTLALHFQFLSGKGYNIEARDGDNINCTLLTRATQSDSGQIVSPGFTTGNVLWIRYHHIYQEYAAAELIITESTGKCLKLSIRYFTCLVRLLEVVILFFKQVFSRKKDSEILAGFEPTTFRLLADARKK